jgi:hypothetical protein
MSEMPSSLFFRQTATTCGTNSNALQSRPNPKIIAMSCFILRVLREPIFYFLIIIEINRTALVGPNCTKIHHLAILAAYEGGENKRGATYLV